MFEGLLNGLSSPFITIAVPIILSLVINIASFLGEKSLRKLTTNQIMTVISKIESISNLELDKYTLASTYMRYLQDATIAILRDKNVLIKLYTFATDDNNSEVTEQNNLKLLKYKVYGEDKNFIALQDNEAFYQILNKNAEFYAINGLDSFLEKSKSYIDKKIKNHTYYSCIIVPIRKKHGINEAYQVLGFISIYSKKTITKNSRKQLIDVLVKASDSLFSILTRTA